MYTLCISTATQTQGIVLIKNATSIDELIFDEGKKSAQKIADYVSAIVTRNNISFDDISRVVISRGPGPFTSVRIGVAYANAFVYAKQIECAAVTTFDLLLAIGAEHMIVTASKNEVFYKAGKNDPVCMHIDAVPELKGKIYADISDSQMEILQEKTDTIERLTSCKKAFEYAAPDAVKLENQIEPLYMREPNITPSRQQS